MTKLRDNWIDGAISGANELGLRATEFDPIDDVFKRREEFAFILDECTFTGRMGYWWPAFAATATAAEKMENLLSMWCH